MNWFRSMLLGLLGPPVTFVQNIRTIYTTLTTTTLKVDTILMSIAALDVRLKRTATKTLTIDDGAGGLISASLLGDLTTRKGTGTASGLVSNVLTVNTTAQGTGNNTTETDLWTYSLPANTLSADGKAVRITLWGTLAANVNTKILRAWVGSTSVFTGNNAAQNVWNATVVVVRTGASAQIASSVLWEGSGASNANINLQTPAENTTGAITLKFTGQNGTASANDIVFRGALVEALN